MIEINPMNMPEVGGAPSESEWMIGQVLQHHSAFNAAILNAREALGVRPLVVCS